MASVPVCFHLFIRLNHALSICKNQPFCLDRPCFHSDEKAQRRVSAFMAHDGARGHCSDTFVVCLQFLRCSHVGNIRALPTDNHLSAFCDKLLSEAASG